MQVQAKSCLHQALGQVAGARQAVLSITETADHR